MITNLTQRQLILDIIPNGKPRMPNKRELKTILNKLPSDTKVIGFGNYDGMNIYYMVLESQAFKPSIPLNISVKSLLSGRLDTWFKLTK